MKTDNIHDGHRKRMMQKYLKNGLGVFEEHEILEMLLFYLLPRVNTNDIAHALINKFGSLANVMESSADALGSVKGMGSNSAAALRFIGDIFNYINYKRPVDVFLDSIDTILNFCIERYRNIPYECITYYLMDISNRLIYKEDFEINSLGAASFNYHQVVKQAILFDAHSVLLAHNHPLGHAFASNTDAAVTRSLNSLLTVININVVDHIIVSGEYGYSMRQTGEMPDIWY